MSSKNSPFFPLRHKAFRSLWIATLFSNLGSLVQAVGAGWMMASMEASDTLVSLVQASTTLPVMLLALAAGAAADNYERRHVMLFAQCFMCVVSASLALAAWFGALNPWALLMFTFLLGCGNALNNPAWQSSMLDLVPKEDLPAAVGLNSMGFNAMRSVGPAIGGLIVASFGASAAFTLNALSYFSVIFALFRWHPRPVERTLPRESMGAAMWAGLRYVSMSPGILRVIMRAFFFGVSGITILALMPVVARDVLGGGPVIYGVLLGAFGVGAIVGVLFSPSLRAKFPNEYIVRGSFIMFALGTAILGFSTWLVLSVIAITLTGAAWVMALSLFNVTVQLLAPRWVVGRALALYQSFAFGGMAFGAWFWGWTSEVVGIEAALVLSGMSMLVGAGLGLIWRLPEFSSTNLDPMSGMRSPELHLGIQGRSGPIMVMIDHRIAHEDINKFLSLMQQRRRIRLRDGARQWALMRDLEDPEIWVESYHVPTWNEYLRQQMRRTQADAESFREIRALHRGPEPPKVHRMIERQTVPRQDDTPIVVQHAKIAGAG